MEYVNAKFSFFCFGKRNKNHGCVLRKVLIFCIEKITKSLKQPPLILDQKSAINNR